MNDTLSLKRICARVANVPENDHVPQEVEELIKDEKRYYGFIELLKTRIGIELIINKSKRYVNNCSYNKDINEFMEDMEEKSKEINQVLNNKIVNELISLLKKTGAIISGSYVLEYLIGGFKKYRVLDSNRYVVNEANDLDIFVIENDNYEELIKFFENFFKLEGYSIDYTYNNSLNDIKHVYYFSYDIQIIVINKNVYNNVIDFIHTTFDLNCCKVVFDGDKFIGNGINEDTFSFKTTLDKLRVYENNSGISKVLNRIKKYINRGFEITFNGMRLYIDDCYNHDYDYDFRDIVITNSKYKDFFRNYVENGRNDFSNKCVKIRKELK